MPYRYQFAVGWIDSAPAASGPPGYVYEPLNVYGDKAPGYTRKVGYFNATPASVPENLANEVNIVGTAGYVLVDTESGGCGSYEGSSYKRVYLLSRTTAYSPAALFASFVINPDYTISQRWIRTTDERFDVQNMSPLVVMPTDEHETPLMIFAIHEVARGQGASTLMIVNADTGETVDEIPFSGRARSTIPIIIGDDIVLTTRDRGLVFFADGTGWLSRHSSGLFSNVPSRIRAYLEQ